MKTMPTGLNLEEQYVEIFGNLDEVNHQAKPIDPNNLAQPSPFADVNTYVTYGTTESISEN